MSSIHSKGIYMCSLVFATVIFLHELGAWVILLGMSRSMKPVPSTVFVWKPQNRLSLCRLSCVWGRTGKSCVEEKRLFSGNPGH